MQDIERALRRAKYNRDVALSCNKARLPRALRYIIDNVGDDTGAEYNIYRNRIRYYR